MPTNGVEDLVITIDGLPAERHVSRPAPVAIFTTNEILGHSHNVELDKNADGVTSVSNSSETALHDHVVRRGSIVPAGLPLHTHELGRRVA